MTKKLNEQLDQLYSYLQKTLESPATKYAQKQVRLKLPYIQYDVAMSIVKHVGNIFRRENIILDVLGDVVVVGDLHGQVLDLLQIFERCRLPPATTYLFLGDLIDRGPFSFETCIIVFFLKLKFPENVLIIRGNHECEELCSVSGFFEEFKGIYPDKSILPFIETFNEMPLGAIINDRILCLHGGIGPHVETIQQIESLQRPIINFLNETACEILWSDPTPTLPQFYPSSRGLGYLYGVESLKKFLDKNHLNVLVRGHQCIMEGVESLLDDKVITVFSASNYSGVETNKGGIIIFHGTDYEKIIFEPLKALIRKDVVFVDVSLPEMPLLTRSSPASSSSESQSRSKPNLNTSSLVIRPKKPLYRGPPIKGRRPIPVPPKSNIPCATSLQFF